MDKKVDCIVIGGGFAGIAAATTLAQHGKEVLLLEPRHYIGGRARSFLHRETGEIIDNGQHLLMGCYTHTLSLLHTFNTQHLLSAQPRMRVDFVEANGTHHPFDTSRLPGKAGTVFGLLLLSGLSAAEKLRAIMLALRIEHHRVRPGEQTAQEFLRYHHQSPRIIQQFWEPIILATLNASIHEASAFLLVEVLRRAFFADARSSQLLFPISGLSELTAPFPAWFAQRRGRIITTTAESFHCEANRIAAVVTPMGTLHTSSVISCIPARALARLLPETLRLPQSASTALSNMPNSPIVSVYLWFDRAFLSEKFVAMLGTTIQWIFNRRLLCTAPSDVCSRYPGHIALTISAADAIVDMTSDEIVQRCIGELHRAFPASRSAVLLHAQVIKEKMATPRLLPAVQAQRSPSATPLRNFFIAGDWTATDLPATIEGACQSGVVAATALLPVLNAEQQ